MGEGPAPDAAPDAAPGAARDAPDAGGARGDARDDAVADAAAVALNRARAAARSRGHAPARGRAGAAGAAGGPPGGARGRRTAAPGGSGARPDARDPQPVAGSIGRLVHERGWAQPVAVGGVVGRWAQVVGRDLAEHCTPERFDAGVLEVRADSTAWATQVRLLAPVVLRRLGEDLGEGVVVRLVVRGPAAPSWRTGQRSVSDGRGPRDTYG